MNVPVVQKILGANDAIAEENHRLLAQLRIRAFNVMASPGAGKTSLILATSARLSPTVRIGVIEGDLASSIDADVIASHGLPVVQINTGGGCHLEASMVQAALAGLPLHALDLIFIENVGNLVCPANFALGADRNIVIASTPEGHDKPHKYPGMFAAAHAVALNKADLLDLLEFDLEYFRRGLAAVNPDAPLFVLSCKTGAGMDQWLEWLVEGSNY